MKKKDKPLKIDLSYENALDAFMKTPPPPRKKAAKKKSTKKKRK